MPNSVVGILVPARTVELVFNFIKHRGIDKQMEEIVNDAIIYWLNNAAWKAELYGKSDVTNLTKQGYNWKNIFLPHGTKIRMKYMTEFYYAEVVDDKIIHNNKPTSPSDFTFRVTGTSRNAWRDISIQFPGEFGWKSADELRKEVKVKRNNVTGKSEKIWRDYIIDSLNQRPYIRHRSEVLKDVKKSASLDGKNIPDTFEQTIQQSFERDCKDSDVYTGEQPALFCFPTGKGSGDWGLIIENVQAYIKNKTNSQV